MTDHLTARYGLIHGAYWASYAAIAAYVNLYLLEMGFSSGAIGVLIALAGLLSALLQPLAASYADRETSPNLKAINLAIAALWMLSALGLLVFHKNKVASLLNRSLSSRQMKKQKVFSRISSQRSWFSFMQLPASCGNPLVRGNLDDADAAGSCSNE